MAFGDNLQNLRRAQGLTQEQFAEELDVSRQAVSKWESGRGYPELEKLLYICRRYGTTLDTLFDMDAPSPAQLGAERVESGEQPLTPPPGPVRAGHFGHGSGGAGDRTFGERKVG